MSYTQYEAITDGYYPSCPQSQPVSYSVVNTKGKRGPIGPAGTPGTAGTNGTTGTGATLYNNTDGLSVGKDVVISGDGQASTSLVYGIGSALVGQLGETVVIGNETAPIGVNIGATAIGYRASFFDEVSEDCVIIGKGTRVGNGRSTCIGTDSGLPGSDNIMIGYQAGNAGFGTATISNGIIIGSNIRALDPTMSSSGIHISTVGNGFGSNRPAQSAAIINWDRTMGDVLGANALVFRSQATLYLGTLPVAPGAAIANPVGRTGLAYLVYDTLSGEVCTSTVS